MSAAQGTVIRPARWANADSGTQALSGRDVSGGYSYPSAEFASFFLSSIQRYSSAAVVVGRISRLSILAPGWNGYGSRSPSPGAVMAAATFANTVLVATDVPPPSVVPTASGGIQFEWHVADVDLEVEFVNSISLEYYFEDLRSGAVEEGQLSYDVRAIDRFLSIVQSRIHR